METTLLPVSPIPVSSSKKNKTPNTRVIEPVQKKMRYSIQNDDSESDVNNTFTNLSIHEPIVNSKWESEYNPVIEDQPTVLRQDYQPTKPRKPNTELFSLLLSVVDSVIEQYAQENDGSFIPELTVLKNAIYDHFENMIDKNIECASLKSELARLNRENKQTRKQILDIKQERDLIARRINVFEESNHKLEHERKATEDAHIFLLDFETLLETSKSARPKKTFEMASTLNANNLENLLQVTENNTNYARNVQNVNQFLGRYLQKIGDFNRKS